MTLKTNEKPTKSLVQPLPVEERWLNQSMGCFVCVLHFRLLCKVEIILFHLKHVVIE